jgi:hypothetical protein
MRAVLRWFGPPARLIAAFIAFAAARFALTLDDVRAIRENGSIVQVGGKLRLDARRTLRRRAEAGTADTGAQAASRAGRRRSRTPTVRSSARRAATSACAKP